MMKNEWDGDRGWPRARTVDVAGTSSARPSCFVQDIPTDPLSASPERLQESFLEFVCQVCGEQVLDVDTLGWVLHPAANMGGACCTRCMYLAVHTCPHLAGAPHGEFEFWAVTTQQGYQWYVQNGGTDGHIEVLAEHATLHQWNEFRLHYKRWKTAQKTVQIRP